MTVAYVSDGNVNPATGAREGMSGGASAQFRRKADGSLEPVPACAEVLIAEGEAMVSISGGGGGYGHPFERDPMRVAHDVREGWVSAERARQVYGIVLSPDGSPDLAATLACRDQMPGSRKGIGPTSE